MDVSLQKKDMKIVKSLILAGYDLAKLTSSQFSAIKSLAKQCHLESLFVVTSYSKTTRENARSIIKYM
jgi:hypothetical protein